MKSGEVRVPTTREQLQTVAAWLARPQKPTLLGGIDDRRQAVAAVLLEAARRKRRFITLPREIARYCGNISANPHLGLFLPATVSAFAEACRAAAKTRAGAPGLTQAQIQQHLRGREYDPRGLRRLRNREKTQQWLDRMTERGETLLSFTEPPPGLKNP